MQAIEFITQAEDGIIRVPKEYINQLKSSLRVIILLDPTTTTSKNTKKKLSKTIQINTEGFKFDRDEANRR